MDVRKIFPFFLLLLGASSVLFSYYYNRNVFPNLLKKNTEVQESLNNESVLADESGVTRTETPEPSPTQFEEQKKVVVTSNPNFSATLKTETKFVGDGHWILTANVSANKDIESCDFEVGFPGMWRNKSGNVAGNSCLVESDRLNFEHLKAWVKVTSKKGDIFETGNHPYN